MKRLCALIMGLSFLIPSLSVKADEEVKLDDFLKGENSSAIVYSDVTQTDTTTRDVKSGDNLTLTLVANSISSVDSFNLTYKFDSSSLQYDGVVYCDQATNDFTDTLSFTDTVDESLEDGSKLDSVLEVGLTGKNSSKFSVKGGLLTINFTALKDFTMNLSEDVLSVNAVTDGETNAIECYEYNLADYLTATGLTDALSNAELTQVEVEVPSEEPQESEEPTGDESTINDSGIHIDINNNNGGTQEVGESGTATQTPTDSNSAKGDWNAAKTSDDGFQKLIGAIAGFIVFASIGGVVIFHNKEKLAKVFKFTHHSM